MAVKERVEEAVANRSSLDGMRKAFRTISDRQVENSSKLPDLDERKERLRTLKERCVGDRELLVQAISSLEANGVRVVIAKTAEAALDVIEHEVKGHRLVVKSKSNVTKEIHLAQHLASKGVEVVETDLGDRIVQLMGCMAVHPTGPSCHLTRQEIAALFSRHFGRSVSDDPRELTEVMRDEIASALSSARVGITGANAITASEGAVVIAHNEGNAARSAMLPDKHIVVATPEKVVPSLEDAMNIVKLQTFLSTGKVVTSFINIVTGPSYTADIEKQLYKGMHGPKEVVVVLVDDGRLSSEVKEPQYCVGCGMCLLHCPVYLVTGPVFGTTGHMGGPGVYLAGSLGKTHEALDAGLYLCTHCGACTEVCPSRIDTKSGLTEIRTAARSAGWASMPEHDEIISSVRNYDNPWKVPRAQKAKWAKDMGLSRASRVLYFAGCSTSLLFPDTAQSAVSLLRSIGMEPAYLGADEPCCGSTAGKIGDRALSRKKAEDCFRSFAEAGAEIVVTSCPGCSSALKSHEDLVEGHGIRVLHIAELLAEVSDKLRLSKVHLEGTVTYHDPCDLGRRQSVYDEPRDLMVRAIENEFVEMERSHRNSSCCGSGGGVKSAYPSLSSAISTDRLEAARACGASVIVTSCPWCVQSLRDALGGSSDIRIMDLVDLLQMSLKP